jgi:hypothetical protein
MSNVVNPGLQYPGGSGAGVNVQVDHFAVTTSSGAGLADAAYTPTHIPKAIVGCYLESLVRAPGACYTPGAGTWIFVDPTLYPALSPFPLQGSCSIIGGNLHAEAPSGSCYGSDSSNIYFVYLY